MVTSTTMEKALNWDGPQSDVNMNSKRSITGFMSKNVQHNEKKFADWIDGKA